MGDACVDSFAETDGPARAPDAVAPCDGPVHRCELPRVTFPSAACPCRQSHRATHARILDLLALDHPRSALNSGQALFLSCPLCVAARSHSVAYKRPCKPNDSDQIATTAESEGAAYAGDHARYQIWRHAVHHRSHCCQRSWCGSLSAASLSAASAALTFSRQASSARRSALPFAKPSS